VLLIQQTVISASRHSGNAVSPFTEESALVKLSCGVEWLFWISWLCQSRMVLFGWHVRKPRAVRMLLTPPISIMMWALVLQTKQGNWRC